MNTQRARWQVGSADPVAIQALQRTLGCPRAAAVILAQRGITAERAGGFLAPTLADLYSPSLLLGMDEAVARIQQATQRGEKILIYGDYDVDGTTATVLLKTAIERIAPAEHPAQVTYHVPHRLREGYGIQTVRLEEAAADGVSLVISVDTGIRAFAAAEQARASGLDLIVTDHHLPDGVEGVPDAVAVINPAQPGCTYPNKDLCGAAVAFKLSHALLEAQAQTDAERTRLEQVLLPSFLKLVALATVADSVALTGENRAMVWLGLRALARPVQPGLRALMEIAELPLDRPPSAAEVAFRIAPRINAAGRMDVASDVVELFLTRDVEKAQTLAHKLNNLNQDRRNSEAAAIDAIEDQLLALRTASGDFPAECIVLDHPEWHRGVLGILASRVVERTHRPALVLTADGEAAHGSGRSVPGFHMLDALTAAHARTSVFTRFGGHAHAVGFSLPPKGIPALREAMRLHASEHLRAELLLPALAIDVELSPSELNRDLLVWLERFEPFGAGNPEPVLLVRSLRLTGSPRTIKERHICLPLENGLSGMGWTRPGFLSWPERIQAFALRAGSHIDCVFRLRENKHPQFGGLECDLLDLRPTT